jgi:hypothetical protein
MKSGADEPNSTPIHYVLGRPATVNDPVAPQPTVERCVWRRDADGVYETDCDNAFCFEDGGARENRARFCMYCGKPIVEERARAK